MRELYLLRDAATPSAPRSLARAEAADMERNFARELERSMSLAFDVASATKRAMLERAVFAD